MASQIMPAAAEAERLKAVRRYEILDTPPDGAFDRIVSIAAELFSVPIAIISIVDHDRIWFKSRYGLEPAEIDREPGLCASAILDAAPWVLTDARSDARAMANPLVAGEFGLQFYVGAPLRTHDGYNLGTLCVIDREPRSVTEAQIGQLEKLAEIVIDQLELRLSARQAVSELSGVIAEKDAALSQAALMAKEIDHRVMNSLQMVGSLLTLQALEAGESDASEQLTRAASRVSAISQVHRHIYSSDLGQRTECRSYLERLCADLSDLLLDDNRTAIEVKGVEVEVPTDKIVPIGLIVNELVTNAAKHGSGDIHVSLKNTLGQNYELSVCNEGLPLPDDFDPATTKGLGMKVIRALVEQLAGRLLVDNFGGIGAKFTVKFEI